MVQMCQGSGGEDHRDTDSREFSQHTNCSGVVPIVGHIGVPLTNSPTLAKTIRVHIHTLVGCEHEQFVGLRVHCPMEDTAVHAKNMERGK